MVCTTSKDSDIRSNILPHRKKEFEGSIYRQFFHENKVDFESLGKLVVDDFTDNKTFKFISPNSKSYAIIYDEAEGNKSKFNGFTKSSKINFSKSNLNSGLFNESGDINVRVSCQLDRISIKNINNISLDSIPM